jgi:hypothetical protein
MKILKRIWEKILILLVLISIPISAFAIVDRFGVDLAKLRKLEPSITTKADVKPGDVIDKTNWKKIDGICPPYILERIKNGTYKMKIGKTEPIPLGPPSFIKATKKYTGITKLDPDGGLINYKGGIPFPKIDPNDPKAALKIMWNFYWKWRGDDLILGEEDGSNPAKRYVIDRHGNEIKAAVGQYMLKNVGRTFLKPIPAFKGREDIEEYELWINYYPRDVSGTTVLWTRWMDPNKWDDMWIYLPSIRRIRRFPTSQRCSTRAPTDYTWDDSWIFQGKVTMFTYKYLGEGKVLTLAHQKRVPFKRNKGDYLPLDEEYEVRDCFVIEQISKDPSYCYGKRIYWVDKEMWMIMYCMLYDRKMEFWKDFSSLIAVPDPLYKKKYGIDVWYPTGGFLYNIQTSHVTITQIPAMSYDVGLKPSLFSLSTLQQLQRGGKITVK